MKENRKQWSIPEQIIEDLISGLTFQFEVVPDSDTPFKLKVFGDSIPFGNREILFDVNGNDAGADMVMRSR